MLDDLAEFEKVEPGTLRLKTSLLSLKPLSARIPAEGEYGAIDYEDPYY